jgi:predicted ATPase
MLRAMGEQIAAPSCGRGAAKAEELFVRSDRLAANQGALAWELRSATSFARLRNRQGRHTEALDILAPVYGRFTQGFGTRDLRGARKVMEASRLAAN